MPDVNPAPSTNQDDEEYLADAYAALDDDRLVKDAESTAEIIDVDTNATAADTDVVEQSTPPTTITTSPVEPDPAPPGDTAATPSTSRTRRVFLIDNKEYPDPDPDLPITGTRSVQAMYRDYFPGQLDNVDVAQKTRADGTIEATFKRRIGTKGVGTGRKRHPTGGGSGELVISLPGVVRVLTGLSQDRPLVWDLVEQAIGPDGAVRLDYVPPAAQLNLAEAQQSARVRLIELAVSELRRLRPSA